VKDYSASENNGRFEGEFPMPMIALTTSVPITAKAAEQLKTGLGEAIALLPGKTEARLMLSLTDNIPMYYQGEERDIAFADVSCFGHPAPEHYGPLTAAICALLERVLALSPANVYVKYSETDNWGWNGGTL
jgi:hypothetical protein